MCSLRLCTLLLGVDQSRPCQNSQRNQCSGPFKQRQLSITFYFIAKVCIFLPSFLSLSPSLPSLSLSFFFKLKAYVLKLSWPISFDSSLSFPVFLITGVKVNVFFILYNCFISYPMCNRQIKRLFNTNYESLINIGMKTFRRTVLLLGQYPLA